MTASAEYAWPSAAPGAVNPRGPGGPQQLRLARLPQDATDHESLIGADRRGRTAAVCHNPDTWFARNGRRMSAAEVFARAARYRHFIGAAGGGLTVSGGEPLLQPAFTRAILTGAKELGLHTALDTSGYVSGRRARLTGVQSGGCRACCYPPAPRPVGRQHGKSWLALAALVALVGGLVMAAAATGRRTRPRPSRTSWPGTVTTPSSTALTRCRPCRAFPRSPR